MPSQKTFPFIVPSFNFVLPTYILIFILLQVPLLILLPLHFKISGKMHILYFKTPLPSFLIQMPILFSVEAEDLGKDYSRISHLFWFTLIVLARFSVLTVLTMLHVIGMLLCLQRAVQYHPRSSSLFLLYITIGIPASIKMTFILPMIASTPFYFPFDLILKHLITNYIWHQSEICKTSR